MTLDELKDKIGIGDDKVYAVMGAFDNPDDLVDAGRKIREMGYTKLDAMSPFPGARHRRRHRRAAFEARLAGHLVFGAGRAHRDTADLVGGRSQLPPGDRRQAVLRFLLYHSDRFRADGLVFGVRQLPGHVGHQRTAAAVSSVVQLFAGAPGLRRFVSCW